MLLERVIGAFTFRTGVYSEVEHDQGFTGTAWLLVAVAAYLNNFGTGTSEDLLKRLLGAAVGTGFALVAFAVASFVIAWMGKTLFSADVTFAEMVRSLGLAYVWNAVGVLGFLSLVSTTLDCVTSPVTLGASLAGLVAWFVAAKEALDIEWGQTIVTVIVGWVVMVAITLFTGVVLGIMGLGAAALGGLLLN